MLTVEFEEPRDDDDDQVEEWDLVESNLFGDDEEDIGEFDLNEAGLDNEIDDLLEVAF